MERWQAADGGMESNIGLLWKLYYTQRLLDGQDDATQIKAIEQAIGFQNKPTAKCSRLADLLYRQERNGKMQVMKKYSPN